ncbi:MAG TPA: HlyD family efflux transporter periplasmic adaptor subunit [Cellvibrionaceae bacterium]
MQITDTRAQDCALPPKHRHKRRVVIISALIVLLAIAAYTFAALAPTFTSDGALDRQSLRLSTLVRGDLVRDIMAQGRVVVANSPTLFSSEGGYVDLYVKAGDTVQKGQALATITSPELGEQLAREKSELTRLQADLERQKIESRQQRLQQEQARAMAEVQLKAMQREKRRADQSWELQIISRLDYEKVLDDLARAKLEHEQASQSLALSDDSLAFYDRSLALQSDSQMLIIKALERRVEALKIISPVEGMVGNVQVDHKQAVAANQALITVVDLTAYEVEASVPEGMASELNAGMATDIQLNGEEFAGVLTAISPEVVGGVVTARIRFSGEMPPRLRQNQRLTARIKLENKPDTLMLERGPFFDSFRGYVFVVREARAEKIPVTLGSRSLRHIEILEGLDPGDQVIVSSVDVNNTVDVLTISQ